MSPRAILAVGLAGMLVYAYPGYLSYDSTMQLLEARSGTFTDVYPPAMTWLWHGLDAVIPGPFAMLLLQCTCLVAGAYLVFSRYMSARAAAICATLLAWFPPVLGALAVIWKDSQMAGYAMLGLGLVLSDRPRVRLAGVGALALAALMRPDAAWLALPIVVALFAREHAGWRRYAIAAGAWLALALAPLAVNAALTDRHVEVAAPADRTANLERMLARPTSSAVYIWFTDIQDPWGSARRLEHDAKPSGAQQVLQPAMRWLGATALFQPGVYLVLVLALIPLCLRDRRLLVLPASALVGLAAVYVTATGPDLRYALWLVIAAVATVPILVATRMRGQTLRFSSSVPDSRA